MGFIQGVVFGISEAKMTKKEKQLWLEAIGKLREFYKSQSLPLQLGKIPFSWMDVTGKTCPLCVVVKNRCKDCLWVKFENNTCITKLFNLDTAQQRLDRLDRWEKKLKDIK